LVPVAGNEADEEVIELASRLITKKGQVYVAHVIPIRRDLPIDAEVEAEIARAEQILDDAEKAALEMGLTIEKDLLQAREIGPAVVNEAEEREVDLIIIGFNYKTRFGEFSLGSVVPYVLKNATCKVMLYQQYLADTD
jgi:nucleotide-binding universal stress UspA family protein